MEFLNELKRVQEQNPGLDVIFMTESNQFGDDYIPCIFSGIIEVSEYWVNEDGCYCVGADEIREWLKLTRKNEDSGTAYDSLHAQGLIEDAIFVYLKPV